MDNFKKKVPPLNSLVALEATVRHRSITLAAKELGVSQAAVSRSIAVLEADLGVLMFVRRHRSIEPTSECILLAETLSRSFSDITQVIDAVRTSARVDVVTIGTTLPFATLWLLPRLSGLRKAFPSAHIRLVSQDARVNLNAGEADVAVRFGVGPFEDAEIVGATPDNVYPVCSRSFADQLDSPERFFLEPAGLIEHNTPKGVWGSWTQWFARAEIAVRLPPAVLHFNHYTDALEAAKAGQGVALGWNILVKRYIEDGSLIRLGDRTVVPDGCYNVIVPLQRKRKHLVDEIARWMVEHLTAD